MRQEHFADVVIYRQYAFPWLTCSPVCSPMDFRLPAYFKFTVYTSNPLSIYKKTPLNTRILQMLHFYDACFVFIRNTQHAMCLILWRRHFENFLIRIFCFLVTCVSSFFVPQLFFVFVFKSLFLILQVLFKRSLWFFTTDISLWYPVSATIYE